MIITFAILSQVSLAQEAPQSQDPPPKFLKVGKTYRALITVREVTFKVLEVNGNWIKVEPVNGFPKKEIIGDIWLNVNSLQLLIEGEKSNKMPNKSK